MKADLQIDDRAFRKSLARYAAGSKKSNQEIITQQAKLFVRDVILITPPNQDYKAQRKLGLAAVSGDIQKIFKGTRANASGAIQDPSKLHQKYRGRDGRVKRTLANKFRVVGLPAYIKKIQKRVGILASGWNAAAQKLGASVPSWIAKHGTAGGKIAVKFGLIECRITITNAVRFATNVKDLVRRVQHALNTRSGAMERQLKSQQERLARKF